MNISKILKIFYFPHSRIDYTEVVLAENLLRAIRKDWKIKILMLEKQEKSPLTFLDLHDLEGQSLASLLKKEHIEVAEFPAQINEALHGMLSEYIQEHQLTQHADAFSTTRHHIVKAIAQELIDYTRKKHTLPVTTQGIASYFPSSFMTSSSIAHYYIPAHTFEACLKDCQRFLQHLTPSSPMQ